MRKLGRGLPWLLLLLAVADWLGLKTGRLTHPAWILAALVGAAIVLLVLLRLLPLVADLVRARRARGAAAGELALVAGILLALLAGSANWLLGLQGFVILHEGEAVPIHGGSHLQEFETGPLARLEEMHLTLALQELELVPSGEGFYYPHSRLAVQRGTEPPIELGIDRMQAGSFGSLRFYQGAFGFAPRIVILKNGDTLFDRVVPFRTRRQGVGRVSFEERFTLEREGLTVEGRIDLASLDEGLRGHATLLLAVSHEGQRLGSGKLLPGHFAEIAGRYRVGFAGLERWSEVDISRRSYGRVVIAGAAVALLGGILWPLASWRGW